MVTELRHFRQWNATKGFTLLEVLVVVAIIALLGAILLPSLSAARRQARETVCASNMHQIHLSLVAYATVNKGTFPLPVASTWWPITVAYGYRNEPDGPPMLPAYTPSSFALLYRGNYIKESQFYYSPSMKDNDLVTYEKFKDRWRPETWGATSSDVTDHYPLVGYNYWVGFCDDYEQVSRYVSSHTLNSKFQGASKFIQDPEDGYDHREDVARRSTDRAEKILMNDITTWSGDYRLSAHIHQSGPDAKPRGGHETRNDGAVQFRRFEKMEKRFDEGGIAFYF